MLVRLLRTIALCWAVAAAAMPGALAIADARAEASAGVAGLGHVESEGGTDTCAVAHGADCAACSMLRHGGATGAAGQPVGAALVTRSLPATSCAAGPRTTARSTGDPRAPPSA